MDFCKRDFFKKIREIKTISEKDKNLFLECLKKSIKNITSWNTESEYQINKIKSLLKDLNKFIIYLDNDFNFEQDYAFNELYLHLEKEYCEECIEYVVSMMMEPYDDITSPLIKEMSSEEEKYFNIPTERTVRRLKANFRKKISRYLNYRFY